MECKTKFSIDVEFSFSFKAAFLFIRYIIDIFLTIPYNTARKEFVFRTYSEVFRGNGVN